MTQRRKEAERWKAIPGFEGLYEVSTAGRLRVLFVRTKSRRKMRSVPRVLGGHVDRHGYVTVSLSKIGQPLAARLHRLILLAFVGACPHGKQAAHLDGNKLNNRLSNLRWVTPKENMFHQVQHGTANRNGGNRLERFQARQIRQALQESQKPTNLVPVLAGQYGVSERTIWRIKHNQTFRTIGTPS